jgi:hypothetical protein
MENRKYNQSPSVKNEIKKIELMNFLEAMKNILGGKKVRRQEWEEKEVFCELNNRIIGINRNGFHGWIISIEDIQGNDWYVVN